jgi:8-oxo-dGTP pyrophosphatase MutT (NUDIX family)
MRRPRGADKTNMSGPHEAALLALGAQGPRLVAGDAVAAIIITESGRYVLQHRDDLPQIWYPGHWGCFGGALEAGEDPIQALEREIAEELELEVRQAEYFTRFDFDLSRLGMTTFYREYYVVRITEADLASAKLHEGQAVRAFDGKTLLHELRLCPYDAFAMFLYHERARLGPAA